MDWWVTELGKTPIGPVTTELLLKGIAAGRVPEEVLVCEVGGTSWRSLTDVDPFAEAVRHVEKVAHVTTGVRSRRLDEFDERTLVDVDSTLHEAKEDAIALRRFDGTSDCTVVEKESAPSEPPRLARMDDSEDRTIVDVIPRPPD